MADNSPTTALEELQSRFPHIYNVYDEKTVLYALLSIYAQNHEYKLGLIDRLYSALGIEDTYDEDLEWRWGSLLNLYRHPNESYSDYRSRLEIVYPSLVGGTAEAIKYAVATAIGLTSDSDVIDQYIHVYDAWEYDGEVIDDGDHDTYEPTTNTDLALNDGFKTNLPYNPKRYGAFVVTVDLSISETIANYQKAVTEAVMNTKASGTQPYIIYLYIFYDSIAIKNGGDDVDTMNINDIKYDGVILAVDDELLPESLTVSHNEIAELLTNDDMLSRIRQALSESTNIHTDDQIVDNINLQNDEENASIIGLNKFFIPMLNNSARLNQSFILSLVDSIDDVDTFKDNINLQQNDIVGIDGSDEYSDTFSISQDEISSLESEIDDMLDIVQRNIQDATSIDGYDNLTDNISSSILQTGAINSAVIQSMWSSNCINGSVTLNGSFITNQHEEADVCIDRIYYNN